MSDKLKPCPFCGSDDIRLVVELGYAEVWCSKCKVTVSRGIVGKFDCLADANEYLKPKVVNVWNRRVEDDR